MQTATPESQTYTSNGISPQQKLHFDPPSHPRTLERNGHPSTNRAQGQLEPGANINPSYLSPYKPGARPALNASRSGSEADSLIDLYGRSGSTEERSVGNSMDRDRALSHEELYPEDEDPEKARWIHRDKLAIIESQEMQEAGIKLPPPQKRSASKSKARREHTEEEEVPAMPTQEAEIATPNERKKQRTRSPIRQGEQDEDGREALVNEYDLRTPEEIAADNEIYGNSFNRQPDLRKSSSRIPLPRSSPMPIPQGHIERDTPLPRKRGASGNWSGEENGISYNKIRSRGNSVGSQVLLDDPDASYNTPTSVSRPGSRDSHIKPRVASNKPTPTHIRKPSITTNTPPTQQKSRQGSVTTSPRTPSSIARPKSRSGLELRPQTAINRPEGEAPWLATMYKPDPRLPPEQQILPTHAKRLQQEQYERAQRESEQRRLNDKASPQLPREFSPLAEHTINGLQPSSKDAEEKAMQERGSEWPLPVAPPTLQKPAGSTPPPPPGPEGGPHAGYSPIPRVKQGESPVAQVPPNRRITDPFEKERLARAEAEKGEKGAEKEVEDGKKKEKGCGCCVVM